MMTRRTWLPLMVAALAMVWTGVADARSFRSNQYPNGTGCEHCHIFPGGPRTNFGLDVEETLDGGNVDWQAIYDIDSDGDGFTNGEEMGDAYGEWERGDNNPNQLSEPQQAFSFPALVGNAPTLQDTDEDVNEDETLEGQLSALDADGDTLRFRIVEGPVNGTLEITNRETGEFTYTPDANYFGSDTFTFQAFDGNNIGTEPGEVSITIAPVNDEPDITTEGDQTLEENDTLTFEVTTFDLEDGALDVDIEGLPEGAQFDDEAGEFTWTPTYFDAGNYELVFSATDNDGATATETIEIEVINVNRPPTIELLDGPDEGFEGDTLTFDADADDLDLEELTYTWEYGDGREASGVDLTQVSHLYPQDGEITLTLSVSDGIDTTTQTFEIVLQNVLPVVTAGDNITVDEGEGAELVGSFVDPGVEDEHEITWAYGDGGEREDQLEVTHAYADDGEFTATLTVADEEGEGSDSMVVTVVNVAPTANAGGNQTIDEGTDFTFPGEFEDPGVDDEHTYEWTFGDGNTDDQRQPTHSYPDQGTFTVSFTVTDDDGGTDTDTITATVINVAPVVVSEPVLYAVLEEEYTYQVEAFDPGDDTISYELISNEPDGLEMDEDGLITYTPPVEEQDNVYTITVHVTDEDGGLTEHAYDLLVGLPDRDGDGADDECEERFNRLDPDDPTDGVLDYDEDGLTNAEECQNGTHPLVSNAPSAPSINAPFNGQLINTPNVQLAVNNGEDPDGDPVVYFFELYRDQALNQLAQEWEDVPEGNNVTRVDIDIQLTEDSAYYWRVRAYDGRGYSPYSAVASFRFSLFNDPPSVPIPVGPVGVVEIETVIFSIQASTDPEQELPIGYDFQVFDSDMLLVDSIIGLPGRGQMVQWPSTFTYEENASYTWRARATDVRGLSSAFSSPLSITINQINSVPGIPELLEPEQGATLESIEAMRFVVSTVEDEDNDPVTYSFRIATDNTFEPGTVIVTGEGVVSEQTDTVTFQAPGDIPVQENATYFWDVRSYDGEAYSPQVVRSFRFSAVNDPPAKVQLQSPTDGESLANLAPTFTWLNVVDPEETPVVYTMEIFSDEELRRRERLLNDIESMGGAGGVTQAEVAALEDNTTYFWRVKAIDADFVEGEWSDVSRFTLATAGEAPGLPTVVSPVEEEQFTTDEDIELVFQNAEDPEGDALVYDIEVLNANDQIITGKTIPESATGQGLTAYTIEVTLAPGTYTWRVRADDSATKSGWSDSGSFLVIEIIPPAPKKEGCSVASPSPTAPEGGLPLAALIALGTVVAIRRRR